MRPEKVKAIQKKLGFSRSEMADLLFCSEQTISTYKATKGSHCRNIPVIRQKILIDAYLKVGGKMEDLEDIE